MSQIKTEKTTKLEENSAEARIKGKKYEKPKCQLTTFTKDNSLLEELFKELDKNEFNEYFDQMGVTIRWYTPRNDLIAISVKKTKGKIELRVSRRFFETKSLIQLKEELLEQMTEMVDNKDKGKQKGNVNEVQRAQSDKSDIKPISIKEETVFNGIPKVKKSVTFADLPSLTRSDVKLESNEEIDQKSTDKDNTGKESAFNQEIKTPVRLSDCHSKFEDRKTNGFPVLFRLPEKIRRIEEYCVCDKRLEKLDPNPDIQVLFKEYDLRYFGGLLSHHEVEVSWSYRLRVTAGITHCEDREKPIQIHLSRKLLSGKPRRDTVETLIHEMIHAWDFIINGTNNSRSDHGDQWRMKVTEIEKMAGINIRVYHDMAFDEKDYLRVIQLKKEKISREMEKFRIVNN